MIGLLSTLRNWRERKEILQEIKRQESDRSERDRFRVRDNLTYALSAIQRDDPRQATELWEKSLRLYPKETRAARDALSVLLGLRRLDEAEALMRDRMKERPRDSFYAIGLTRIIAARGDQEAIIKHCAALRKDFPGVFEGYVMAADALMTLKRLDEAEVLVQQAMQKFPDNLMGFMANARIATEQENWEEALGRWKFLFEQFKWPAGAIGWAQALVQLGRYDEADAVLETGRLQFPVDPSFPAEAARVAEARGDIPQVIERWKRLVQRFPLHMPSNMAAATALWKLDCFEDAETILRGAVEHFPTEVRPALELALFLFRRQDFAGASDMFADIRATFPENEAAYKWGIDALVALGRADDAEALRAEHRAKFKA